jgi:hypothetical protein
MMDPYCVEMNSKEIKYCISVLILELEGKCCNFNITNKIAIRFMLSKSMHYLHNKNGVVSYTDIPLSFKMVAYRIVGSIAVDHRKEYPFFTWDMVSFVTLSHYPYTVANT